MANVKSCSEPASGDLRNKCVLRVQSCRPQPQPVSLHWKEIQPDCICILNGCLKGCSLSSSPQGWAVRAHWIKTKDSNLDNAFYFHGDLEAAGKLITPPSVPSLLFLLPTTQHGLCSPLTFIPAIPCAIFYGGKVPVKWDQTCCFTFSFWNILYNFEMCSIVRPVQKQHLYRCSLGLDSFPFYFCYPARISSNISMQKFWELHLIDLVTFFLVQCLVNSKYLIGLLSEGVNKDSYFCFLLEAVSLVFGFLYLYFLLHSGQFPHLWTFFVDVSHSFTSISRLQIWFPFMPGQDIEFVLSSWVFFFFS